MANVLSQTFVTSALNHFLLSSLISALDLAVVGTAWVNEETETSLDVEWENPLTEVDYYKLRYGPLTGQEVTEVTVPKSRDPKSRYDITGKSLHWEIPDVGCRSKGGGRQCILGLRNHTGFQTPRYKPTLVACCLCQHLRAAIPGHFIYNVCLKCPSKSTYFLRSYVYFKMYLMVYTYFFWRNIGIDWGGRKIYICIYIYIYIYIFLPPHSVPIFLQQKYVYTIKYILKYT